MDFPAGVMLTVKSTTTDIDDDGDSTTESDDVTWGPCALAPRSSEERENSRQPAVLTGLTIYGPDVTLDADDLVVIPSGAYAGTWQVEGVPGVWQSPFTGWAPGIEVAVKRAS